MQQTEKYKLNLIERSDPFLPDALNENTQKVEEVLKETLEPMDGRVAALESRKLAYGAYSGKSSDEQFIYLGFTPKAVLVVWLYSTPAHVYMYMEGAGDNKFLRVADDGFYVFSALNTTGHYRYIALD